MFEEIADILKRIKNTIHPETVVVWPGLYTDKELLRIVDGLIIRTQKRDKKVLSELDFLFAPTGNFKLLADANNWADDFTKYATRFDAAFEKAKGDYR